MCVTVFKICHRLCATPFYSDFGFFVSVLLFMIYISHSHKFAMSTVASYGIISEPGGGGGGVIKSFLAAIV